MGFLTTFWRRVGQPREVTVHGIPVSAVVDSTLKSALYEGSYQRSNVALLRERLEADDHVLDLGTGLGLTALTAAAIVGQSQVLTVEASPAAIALARDNFARNGRDIELLEGVATGVGGGPRCLYVNTCLVRSSLFARAGTLEELTVPALNVSALLDERAISVLHVDLEGGELALFEDLALPARVRLIVLEMHEQVFGLARASALLERLFALGFALDFDANRGRTLVFVRVSAQPDLAHS